MFIGKEENDETAYNTNDIQMYQKLLQTYAQAIKTSSLDVLINSCVTLFNTSLASFGSLLL